MIRVEKMKETNRIQHSLNNLWSFPWYKSGALFYLDLFACLVFVNDNMFLLKIVFLWLTCFFLNSLNRFFSQIFIYVSHEWIDSHWISFYIYMRCQNQMHKWFKIKNNQDKNCILSYLERKSGRKTTFNLSFLTLKSVCELWPFFVPTKFT